MIIFSMYIIIRAVMKGHAQQLIQFLVNDFTQTSHDCCDHVTCQVILDVAGIQQHLMINTNLVLMWK